MFDIIPLIQFKKTENVCEVFVYKKEFLEFFTKELGLALAPKWNRAIIPEIYINSLFGKYLLRGYFDTDGSLVLTNNNGILYPRLEMKISPSPMQKQFISILKMYEFHFGVYNIGKGKVRIQLNGKKELDKWIDIVGFKNMRHLKKLERFKKTQ